LISLGLIEGGRTLELGVVSEMPWAGIRHFAEMAEQFAEAHAREIDRGES
jgi:hypothetical protein